MKRNPLLGSMLLACVCLLAAASVTSHRVMAQGNATEGSLQAIDENGKLTGQCPLKHTSVKTEISGFLARVIVTQQFDNPFPDKIEAVYTFPLPPAAAIDDMTIVIGERTVKGKIMRREDAQAAYDAARAKGQVAALLNQQRPNIFTQAVANILPGQKIDVTISYVETLKYDEGSYEWSFPMVVAPRYIPAPESTPESAAPAADTTTAKPETAASETPESETPEPETTPRVPDAALISPPVMSNDERAGHDISIEVNIDAGVPLVSFKSKTHEIDALQPGSGKAIVRLRDQATIPNKDFVLRYAVAGSRIEDALLSHRDSRGGFFTLILQPPQRVTAADTMPKELVFVLDTSGSMEGFPLDKAKETMMLALDDLYPQDTFNVITFAGDTRILFPSPVPATPENLRKAKDLLAHTKSSGGTEMMKAIRAALAPSDAQAHVRITCFMTDGQVGNDMEIIAEVQKYSRARVFAMGFGSAPNRFLLDKITEYGRGEAEYVTANGNTAGVAKRFHERIRNPLLTDVSIDWNGLPITDVYPKTIPDLFSAKPVVVSGRYSGAGSGTIRLRGMMSGHESVREIAINLPEQETAHDVLATLWARRKVDDLMGQDMKGIQAGTMREDLKTEIVNLGLAHRLLTQFTSFVAVEESRLTDGVEPRRVDVAVEAPAKPAASPAPAVSTASTASPASLVTSYSGMSEMVTVEAQLATIDTTSTSITTRSAQELPLQGRSFQGFILLTPGSVSPGPANPVSSAPVNISVNGQRPSSNQFTIDGVDGNVGISPGGQAPGASASGGTPALTATGGTSAMASVNAVEEVTIRTFGASAEFGRNSGAQIAVVTKSGTNAFHGSAFYLFGHEALDANDWFANSRALRKPRHRLSDFGGAFGGPIQRDSWFFFGAYEGLRLRQPVVALTDVPALSARLAAPQNTQPLLNLFPLPNGPERADGFAQFPSSFANAGRHDVGSFRIDGYITQNFLVTGHVNLANSSAVERGAGGFSLNTVNHISNRAQSVTGKAAYTISPQVIAEARANYSHFTSRSAYQLDTFGGATLPASSIFTQPSSPESALFSADLNARGTQLMSGSGATNTQRQFNVLGALNMISGNHTFSFGADYRRLFPIIGMREHEESALFDGVTQALTGQAARLNFLTHRQPQRPVFNGVAIYGKDEWRATTKLTLNYGLRWELSPAPSASEQNLLAIDQAHDPARLTLAPHGTPLWKTTFGNFAPRVGVAYQPLEDDNLVIRGSFGILYDVGNSAVGDAYADSFPFLNGSSQFNVPFSFDGPAAANPTAVTVPFSAFDPQLRLPRSIEWSASAQAMLGYRQSIMAAYVGNAGRRLLVTSTLLNQNSNFEFLRLTNNGASSSYHALQLQFNRPLANGFGAMVSYTLAKATDNSSQDSAAHALFRSLSPEFERGPSDFDIRHTLSGYVSYEPPAIFTWGLGNSLTRSWTIDALFNVRSSSPVNVVYSVPTSFGFLYLRPDVVPGAPLYTNDAAAAGGRRINAAAFAVPQSRQDLRQGALGRNALRGYPLAQVNLALRRRFTFTEDIKLTLGAEAANLFNHANFAAPAGKDASLGTRFDPSALLTANPTFGQSYTNAARSPWGITGSSYGASYYPGGARTMKLTAKLEF